MGRQFRPPRRGGPGGVANSLLVGTTLVAIPNYGITDLSGFPAGDVVLDSPDTGVTKTLVWASSSSVAVVVRMSTGTSVKVGNTAATQITFGLATSDCAAQLVGLNSTRWAVISLTISSTLGTQSLSTIPSMSIGTS